MSDSDEDSSSVEALELNGTAKNEEANPLQRFCFFLTETGRSLEFVLLPDNMINSDVVKVTELIKAHLGFVSTSKKDIDAHTAVLVADNATSWDYCGDVFKLSYIHDCIAAGKLLNIAQYLKNPPSRFYVKNFDYMSVIYDRKYSWETISPIDKLPKHAKDRCKPPREDANDSDGSTDSLHSIDAEHSVTHPRNYKQTKQAYSLEEKEAMLRYVVGRKLYNRLKSKTLYKEMEAANVCPIRTWQSMKDHFLRYLAKEIPRYSFLSSKEKKELRDGLHPYSR